MEHIDAPQLPQSPERKREPIGELKGAQATPPHPPTPQEGSAGIHHDGGPNASGPNQRHPIATVVSSAITTAGMSCWDDLETGVRALQAEGYPAAFDETGYDLFDLLDSVILASSKNYKRFLQYNQEIAQLLVDALQWVGASFLNV